MLLHQQADVLDPNGQRQEPGHYQGVGCHKLTIDIQLYAEETNEDDNRQHQKGEDRFHNGAFSWNRNRYEYLTTLDGGV
jgi:hypothetical protein